MAKGNTVDLVALRGFVGEDRDDDGRKVRHASGDKIRVTKATADALLHSRKAAPSDSAQAKQAVAEAKEAAKAAKADK